MSSEGSDEPAHRCMLSRALDHRFLHTNYESSGKLRPKNQPLVQHCLLVSSDDNFYKQFGPRSGPTNCLTQVVFLKEFFEKVDFEKKSADNKKSRKMFHGSS